MFKLRTFAVNALRLNKRLLGNEEGLTIVEMMTSLVIVAMVTTILFSFLFMGISMYKRVNAESQIRNQGDVLISQVIAELKDAVYVTQPQSDNKVDRSSITYVKRAMKRDGSYDSAAYVIKFSMSVEQIGTTSRFGIVVRNLDLHETVKQFELSETATIRKLSGDYGFWVIQEGNDRVRVHLLYERLIDNSRIVAQAENPTFEIDTQIPLFRYE